MFVLRDLGGYFLEARQRPDFYELVQEQMTIQAFAITGVVVIVGIPLMFLLRSAFVRA